MVRRSVSNEAFVRVEPKAVTIGPPKLWEDPGQPRAIVVGGSEAAAQLEARGSQVEEDMDALAVLLDVRAELANLQSQVAEQHRQITAQLRALAVSGDVVSASDRSSPYALRARLTSQSVRARQTERSQPSAVTTPMLRNMGSLADSVASHALARGITFQEVMTAKTERRTLRLGRYSAVSWRRVVEDCSQGRVGQACKSIVNWHGFDRAIGCIIFLNAVCIGVEIDMNNRNSSQTAGLTAIEVAEPCFLFIYFVELMVRFIGDPGGAVKSGWVMFDATLVFVGVSTQILVAVMSTPGGSAPPTLLGQLTLFRVVRLLRLVRALRLVKQFKTLWRLVNGLLNSFDAILSTLALIVLVVYVASCIGVELILTSETLRQSEDEKVRHLLNNHFNSLENSMLTLLRFVTVDSLAVIYEPIIQEQPLFSLYFMLLLMVISIFLLNMVTATVVEGALESANQDKETLSINMRKRVRQYVPIARELFRCMDASGDGVLTFREIRDCLTVGRPHAKALYAKLSKVVPFDSAIELFESLDMNGDGEISEEEFVQGILKSALGDRDNIEITQVLRLVRVIARKLQPLGASLIHHSLNGCAPGSVREYDAHGAPVFQAPPLDREDTFPEGREDLIFTAESI